jgi:hypothetical protein
MGGGAVAQGGVANSWSQDCVQNLYIWRTYVCLAYAWVLIGWYWVE